MPTAGAVKAMAHGDAATLTYAFEAAGEGDASRTVPAARDAMAGKAWLLFAFLTCLLYGGCNFLGGVIGKEAADAAHAGASPSTATPSQAMIVSTPDGRRSRPCKRCTK